MKCLKDIIQYLKPDSIIIGDELNVKLDVESVINISDVRSAGFYALGQSKITNENIVLVINGEFLPNLYTVLTEAWFQKTNLVVFAIYDSIYEIENHYLDRCLVSNIKFIDSDYGIFEEKIKNSVKLIGPKLFNIVTESIEPKKRKYGNIIEILDKYMDEEDDIFIFNMDTISTKAALKIIPEKYKYGILSKYLAFTTLTTKRCVLLCNSECLEIDSNIFNSRYINNKFKLIITGDINKTKDWIETNKIEIRESKDVEKDIENMLNEDRPMILNIKEEA